MNLAFSSLSKMFSNMFRKKIIVIFTCKRKSCIEATYKELLENANSVVHEAQFPLHL